MMLLPSISETTLVRDRCYPDHIGGIRSEVVPGVALPNTDVAPDTHLHECHGVLTSRFCPPQIVSGALRDPYHHDLRVTKLRPRGKPSTALQNTTGVFLHELPRNCVLLNPLLLLGPATLLGH